MPSKHKGCDCEKCRECCTREPGWFVPNELGDAATFMDMTEQAFIAYYCEEHFEDDIYALSPTTKPKTNECVFFNKKGQCDIHPVKPYECRKVYGCEGVHRHRKMRDIVKRMWR